MSLSQNWKQVEEKIITKK